MISKKTMIKVFMFLVILSIWLHWDISQAGKSRWSPFNAFKPLRAYDAVTSATTKVAIVRSDDPELSNPTPITDASITYNQIEDMVRKAIELAGGFDWVIKPGDMVLLKPNIVDPEPPGCGEITDVRVIKALIKIIDEIDHGNMKIVVGEGSPRPMDYEMDYQSKFSSPCWDKLWDVSGYQDLLTDSHLEGINFRLSNLNGSPKENPWQDLVEVDAPDGGQATPQGGKYWIHKDVLDADVYITVPVMKIHNPGITVALKNQIGLAPSTMYGFSKSAGVPQDSYKHKLHTSATHRYWTDKEIVDLSNLAQIKYVVVDAIACLERSKGAIRSGGVITNLVRMNSIVAGADVVAVDHVCTRLMGLNPHDIGHVTLAERVGLGTNNPDNIHIVGADLEQTAKRFIKTSDPAGNYGETNRVWLLNGPYPIEGIDDPMEHQFIADEMNVKPVAEQNGWSEPIYFTEDWIDLYGFFDLSSTDDVVGYAFSYFDAPKDQEAELWIGSDEALAIYINGNEVYSYNGTRSFRDYYTTKVKAPVKAGENTLLVKSLQKVGRYEFSINICEPESNPNFDGNRIWGLIFKTTSNNTSVKQSKDQTAFNYELMNAYPNPFNPQTKLKYSIPEDDYVKLDVYNLSGEKVHTIVDAYQSAGDYSVVWDVNNSGNKNLATGMYIANLKTKHFHKSIRLLYVK